MSESGEAPSSSFNGRLGFEVEDFDDGTSRLTLAPGHELKNELGITHGGVPMAMLDSAMGRTAVRSMEPGSIAATVQFSVQFIAPAEGRLTATARVVRSGRSVTFMEGECHREDGALVARAHGTWAVRRPAAEGR